MARAGASVEEELPGQLKEYRAVLRRQFYQNCGAYLVAWILLAFVVQGAHWAFVIVAFWTIMLACEGCAAFGRSESGESSGFLRWQRRKAWVAAGKGDTPSLKRLQNVQ